VLKKAPDNEHEKILASIDASIRYLPQMIQGDWAQAMNHLHSFQA
jgi:PTH1 family peptidyl-tRNA hydrolase